MRIAFRAPELRELDRTSRDLLTLYAFEDERPFRGLTGLVDWRLNSRVARMAHAQHVSGAFGETMLMPGYGRLPVGGVLLLGLGSQREFSLLRFREVIQRHLRTLIGLRAWRVGTPLPPWEALKMRPVQAIEFWTTELAHVLSSHRDLDLDVVLFEPVEAQRAMMDTVLTFVRRYGA